MKQCPKISSHMPQTIDTEVRVRLINNIPVTYTCEVFYNLWRILARLLFYIVYGVRLIYLEWNPYLNNAKNSQIL